MMQNTLFSNVPNNCMSIIGTITAANIVGVMIANRKNWASVANYVQRILSQKKRGSIRNRDLDERNSGEI